MKLVYRQYLETIERFVNSKPEQPDGLRELRKLIEGFQLFDENMDDRELETFNKELYEQLELRSFQVRSYSERLLFMAALSFLRNNARAHAK